jgi:cell division protein FtsZ
VLYSGVACISDLIVKDGLINLDFADVRALMREKGKAMMGRGEASGAKRALDAAEAAISNPLIEDPSIKRASGLIISISGGKDLTLFEVDQAATRIREEVDEDANIIVGATFDESLEGILRVSVVATGIDNLGATRQTQPARTLTELAGGLRDDSHGSAERIERSAPRPQSSGDPPGFFRMTKEALLGLEKGLRPSASNQRSHQAPKLRAIGTGTDSPSGDSLLGHRGNDR